MKKIIKINYIKDKVDKSHIITIEDNISIVSSQKTLKDIKKNIIGILDCTDINEKLNKNNKWTCIYKLEDNITNHLFRVISENYDKKKKKEIIRKILKEINSNILIIIINWNNIFINDSWIKKS